MKENQKKVPAKRIQLVDVVLERKDSQLFGGRRVRSPDIVLGSDKFLSMKEKGYI